MQIINSPDKKDWYGLLQRPYYDNSVVLQSVQSILNEVKQNGDAALKSFAQKFDGVQLKNVEVTEEDILNAEAALPEELKAAKAAAESC